MILYGLKNCDTCRKALRAMPEARLSDVRTHAVPEDVLDRALAQFGDALINTRSTTWRGLSAEAKARPSKDLILSHPALMKRPLIVVDNVMFLGWNNEIESEVNSIHQSR